MSANCCNPAPCVPGRLVDPLAMTPFPVEAFPTPGDDNRYSVLLGDDGSLYISDGVNWNVVGVAPNVPDFSASPSGSKYQSFRIMVRNDGGTIQHAISTSFNSFNVTPFTDPGELASKVIGASPTMTATPIGPIASLTPAAGAMIPTDGVQIGTLIIDTAEPANGDFNGHWTLTGTNVSTLINFVPALFLETINGETRLRMYLSPQTSTGTIVRIDQLTANQYMVLDFAGYMT